MTHALLASVPPGVTNLVVAGCSPEAARHAVVTWHYSRSMPVTRLLRLGVWEDDRFVGAVIFGIGANRNIGGPYGLQGVQVCELARVALGEHKTPTSAVVAAALAELGRLNPGLRLVVSYADQAQGHVGVLYQAGNWLYMGEIAGSGNQMRIGGQVVHKRTLSGRCGTASVEWLREHVDPAAEWVKAQPKHCYVMPLDRGMRRQLQGRALPFPRGSGLHGEPSASPG